MRTRSVVKSLLVLFLLGVVGTTIVLIFNVYNERWKRVARDSAVSGEFAIIRSYLSEYYDDHSHYPYALERFVTYNGDDFHLDHLDEIDYTPSTNHASYRLKWTSSVGDVYEEIGYSGRIEKVKGATGPFLNDN